MIGVAKRRAKKVSRRKVVSSRSSSKKRRKKKQKFLEGWHAVPLPASFMMTAILGFFISVYYVYPQSLRFGFTFMLVFLLMFIAALVSMTKAPLMGENV